MREESRVSATWSKEELHAIGSAHELDIAVQRPNGQSRPWTPIWVISVHQQVYVRTWRRRETGWFGDAVRAGHARVRVPGMGANDVTVKDLGHAGADLQAGVDAAYRAKYGPGAESMVNTIAVTTTLGLTPDR